MDVSSNNLHEKTCTLLRKANLTKESELILIAAENNVIRTNRVKARIYETKLNSIGRVCVERDETINHIISDCCKFAQKELKTRYVVPSISF